MPGLRSLWFFACKHMLYTSIRYKPNQGNQNVESKRDPLRPKSQRNGNGVDDWRQLALPITTDSLLQKRVSTLRCDDELLQYPVGDSGHEQDYTIESRWHFSKVVLSHPAGNKGDQR